MVSGLVMLAARRLISAVLTLALAHFGVVATAPAHAHEVDAPHGTHALELHHYAFAEHDHADRHDQADRRADASGHGHDGADGAADTDGDGSHTVFHVHCCPHFAPADPAVKPSAPVASAARLTPPDAAALRTVSAAPPFRPPRSFL